MEVFSLLLAFACLLSSEGRPDGAPTSACSSLTPAHSGIQAQRSSAPYSVSASKVGSKVRVRISSNVGEEIEGFVLQARYSSDRQRMAEGQFTVKEGVTRTIDCFRGSKNTLTQVNPSPKMEIVTEWTPRNGDKMEHIIFRATVAKTFAIFWTEIDSESIKIQGDSSISGRSERKEEMNSDRKYDNCFVSKGCFGLPAGCINSRDCDVLLTYTKAIDGISFKMDGMLASDNYMALGISNDALMGDDFVTECVRTSQSNRIAVRHSYNDGKSNTRTTELSRDRYDAGIEDGMATCSFTADYLTEFNFRQFNLENSTYYVLLAKGPVNNNRINYHSSRTATQQPVNFTAFQFIESEGVNDAIKVHGTFMVTGWIGLVSLGILLARHFKDSWEKSTLFGVKIWFAFHRGLMVLSLSFIVISFIVIFVYKNGWNYETSNPHAVLGCIATAFGVFQPIMALFRPSPDSPNRIIFNWLHWGVGNAAQIIAVVTIFFAAALESSGLKNSFYWVISIFVVLHLIFHLAFQVHIWTSGKKKNNEMKMLELARARAGRGSIGAHNNMQEKGIADNVFRLLLLGIYVIFLAAVLIALYILIGSA